MAKNEEPFNPAFQNLGKKVNPVEDPSPCQENQTPPSPRPGKQKADPFLEAMSDVSPLPDKGKRKISGRGAHIRPRHPAPDDEKEVMSHLYGLVRGSLEMDISFSDEYMEGSVKGFSRKLMKKLKKGEFAIQDHIDLHGLTKQEAETQVMDFLVKSHRTGLRCVLIVHGRGLNSPDSFPVLKEGLPRWLGKGPAKKIVLAFTTARPYDGGTGAIYVLLRKP